VVMIPMAETAEVRTQPAEEDVYRSACKRRCKAGQVSIVEKRCAAELAHEPIYAVTSLSAPDGGDTGNADTVTNLDEQVSQVRMLLRTALSRKQSRATSLLSQTQKTGTPPGRNESCSLSPAKYFHALPLPGIWTLSLKVALEEFAIGGGVPKQ
jgi:hypothetical protein